MLSAITDHESCDFASYQIEQLVIELLNKIYSISQHISTVIIEKAFNEERDLVNVKIKL